MRSSDRPLEGWVAVVTGGARGIGLATATALRSRGARVAIGDVDEEAVHAAADSLGPDVVAGRLDVTDPNSFAAFVVHVERDPAPDRHAREERDRAGKAACLASDPHR